MRPCVIMFNGPPGSGKDTGCRFLIEHFGEEYQTAMYSMADPLKTAAHTLVGDPKPWQAYEREDRGYKDRPLAVFGGMTPRSVYISLSEDWAKPRFGDRLFGHAARRQLASRMSCFMHVINDAGFVQEVEPIIQEFGLDNCLLLQLSRPGCTFDGDSRSYWTREGMATRMIHNLFPLEWYRLQVVRFTEMWLKNR